MPLATARPWLIAVLFGLMALSPTRAGMTDAEVKAFTQDKALAEKGDHVAQYNMGVRYYHGLGVAKDFVQAVSWWRKAAEQGGIMGSGRYWVVLLVNLPVRKIEVLGRVY